MYHENVRVLLNILVSLPQNMMECVLSIELYHYCITI